MEMSSRTSGAPPGVQAFGIDPQRFNLHMNAQAANVLLESRFTTYQNHYVPPVLTHTYQ